MYFWLQNADMNQWLQIELTEVKKITGIITQGAKSMGKEMYIVSFTLEYSEDGVRWTQYTDDEEYISRVSFIRNAFFFNSFIAVLLRHTHQYFL